jgi:single-strand DNA-binding protein
MNQMIVIGNLTRDPEMKYSPKGVAVTRFGVATNAGKERKPEFHNVVVFGQEGKDGIAGSCAQYLKKGSKVCVVGEHQTQEYEAQDGSKRRSCQIVARQVEFLSQKENSTE